MREVAALLSQRGRGYRIGGDEFALLAPVADADEAAPLGRWVCDAARERFAGVTISLGVAVAGRTETDTDLLARADATLYDAKSAGRDQIILSPPGD